MPPLLGTWRKATVVSIHLVIHVLGTVIAYALRSVIHFIREACISPKPDALMELEGGRVHPWTSMKRSYNLRITTKMRIEEVVLCLVQHGCSDITPGIDINQCDQYPFARGGFGSVYKGRLKDGRLIAIKCIERAARELYTWSKCRHPGVLQLLGLAQFRGQIALVSPLVAGGCMTRSILQYSPAYRLRICIQITEALEYLRLKGIVHGDIKPDNVIVNVHGWAQLADFGSASLSDNTSLAFTRTGSTKFTTRYAAPELLSEASTDNTFEADIYALGMTILFTVTGKLPYADKSNPAMMYEVTVKRKPPPRPTELDQFLPNRIAQDQLWALLLRCWDHKPGCRPTPLETKEELLTIQQNASTGSK